MDLYVMRYVVALAEYQNFSLAAQACYIGQSALSQQIAKLEKELGISLFYRHPRGASVTEAGEEFVRRARNILQLSDALQSEMALHAGLRRGTLNLGIITSLQCIDFGGLLSSFCEHYPGISVNTIQGGTHRLLQQLVERKLDLAFLNKPVSGLPAGISFLKLGEDLYRLAVPNSHPLAAFERVNLSQLKDFPFIFHEASQVAAELCFNACQQAGFTPDIICRSASPTTSLYMVQGGLGIALLPSEEFRSHHLEGVKELYLEDEIRKEVGIAWRTDTTSPLVEATIQFAKKRCLATEEL